MKKSLLFSFFILLISFSSYGNPVSFTTAQQVASHFWTAVTGDAGPSRWSDVTAQTGFQEFYVLKRESGNGFVIVSADDCVKPILGYSDHSQFVTPLPAHVASFLQRYDQKIAYCKANGIQATKEIERLWESLTEGLYSPLSTTAITPLLSTTWNQRPYYNSLCPDSSDVHAVTGCVATATAQVMKYWNWPPTGVGSHEYEDDNFGYQYANFGAATYNWSLMPDALTANSSAEQINAVATLMYHVGVAVEMDYGIDGSAAYMNSYDYSWLPCSENALKDYFRYKNTLHSVYKEYVTDAEWISTLTNELNAGRPVLERGHGDAGGHAFVCDGYDNNGLFHINWGWGGYVDGYFSQDALNPDEDTYNEGVAIVVGVEPDGQFIVNTESLLFMQEGGTLTFSVTPSSSSSSAWTVSSNATWLSLSPSSGTSSTNTTVNATATANNSAYPRSALITVTQGQLSATIHVTQLQYASEDSCLITSFPWVDGFENGIGCWSVIDSDGDGRNWSISSFSTYEGDSSMISDSWTSADGAIAAHNYLVTPAILLPSTGTYSLIFNVRSANVNYPDSLMIKLTQGTGTDISEFTTTLFPLTVIPHSNYQTYTISLSDYNGQAFKIAFVHDSYDGYYLSIDNVTILNTSTPYTYTVVSSDYSKGYASGGGTYYAGTSVTLSAAAYEGYRFTGWSDGSTLNPRNLVVMGDMTYTAYFEDLGDSIRHYDNGTYSGHIGAGGSMYWGIRFPEESLTPYTTLSAVRIFDQVEGAGSYEVKIYQGGNYSPSTLITSQTYELTGTNDWFEAVLDNAVVINHEQPLWIVLYNNGVSYPAAGSNYAGNHDGSWVSTDGSNWTSVCDYELYYTWMLRAVLVTSPSYTVTVQSSDNTMGSAYGNGTFISGSSAVLTAEANTGYRFTGWNDGNVQNPRTVIVTGDVTYTANFANLGDSILHYDNGEYASSIGTGGGAVYWGVRFPEESFSSYNTLNAVRIFDQIDGAGSYELRIYQGGYSSPSTLITSQTYELTGTDDWFEAVLDNAVVLNHAQPLWIVFYSIEVPYPAAGSYYAGNADGSWVSTDGSYWDCICNYNDLYYTWMIRAVLAAETPSTTYTITTLSSDNSMGSVGGSGSYAAGSFVELTANASSGYRFTGWNDGSTENPRMVFLTSDTTFTAQFADLGDSIRHYDNGTYASYFGYGGEMSWGVRFPAGSLSPYPTLSSVRLWDITSGTYVLRIYEGGTDSPGTLLLAQSYETSGSQDWLDVMLNHPILLDHTQSLWIVLYSYPAVGSDYAGNPDGSWISLNGEDWNSIVDYGYNLTWMIRAGLTNTLPCTVTVQSSNNMGMVFGGGTYISGGSVELRAEAISGCRFTGWSDGNTENPRTVIVTSDTTFIAYFADLGESIRHYDNGVFATGIGRQNGGSMYWGVRFPAGSLAPYDKLSSVWVWDIAEGSYDLMIYQGGYDSPEMLVTSRSCQFNNTSDWSEQELYSPVLIDHTQPLWIVFSGESMTYPAAGSNYAGNPDGSWISLNGNDWYSLCDYNLNYTWMIRAELDVIHYYTVTVQSSDTTMGVVSGGGTYMDGSNAYLTATANNGYRFTGWNDSALVNPRYLYVTGDTTIIANFADLGDSIRHYDNGTYATSIGDGTGGPIYWGIQFPAGTLSPYNTLSSVLIWDYAPGNYELRIYQGGIYAPGTLITSQVYELNGSLDWYEAVLSMPVTINQEQPLWIVFYCEGVNYPATASYYAGTPYGSIVSSDGLYWTSIYNYNLSCTWMIRAVLTNTVPTTTYTINVNSAQPEMGTATGGGTYPSGMITTLTATANSGYRFTGWNDGSTENPHTILVTGDATYTANFADLGDSIRHYDNGAYYINVGSTENDLYWGIRFPAGSLSPYPMLKSVRIWDYSPGNYELRIYQGGTDAPGTLVASQNYELSGSLEWYEAVLSTPIAIDHTQPVWVVLRCDATAYPAAGSHYAGNPDGSWISEDGLTWRSICDYNYFCTWMIRAVLYNPETPVTYTITVNSAQPEMGMTIGSGDCVYGSNIQIKAVPYDGYMFTHWSDNDTTNPRIVTVTCDTTFTAYFQPVVGIEDRTISNIEIFSDKDRIVVNGAEGTSVEVFDMTGKLIESVIHNELPHRVFTVHASGVYVVRTGNGVIRKVQVIR